MTQYLPEPRRGLLPDRLGDRLDRALQHQEARALIQKRDDQLRLARVEEATARGLVAAGQIASLEATLARAVPHAEGRLRAIADAGTIGIAGLVARSGF
jgi:hypothetical protein